MTADQAERIGLALQRLTELQKLSLLELKQESAEADEWSKRYDEIRAPYERAADASLERLEARSAEHRERSRRVNERLSEITREIHEKYRREEELLERLASLDWGAFAARGR